jgi:hypothetical protein
MKLSFAPISTISPIKPISPFSRFSNFALAKFSALLGALSLSLAASSALAAEGDPATALADAGAWRVQMGPFTHHFRASDDHKDVVALGMEYEAPNRTLYGLTAFTNSFGQPSAYLYCGWVYNNIFNLSESLYFKLTVGVLYGYVEPYENKVPLNYKGFSPGVIPSIGWHLDKSWSVQLNVLGNAAVMVMLNKKL